MLVIGGWPGGSYRPLLGPEQACLLMGVGEMVLDELEARPEPPEETHERHSGPSPLRSSR